MDISKYIGLPYKPMGREYEGVDCFGLVYLIYRDVLQIDIPTYVDDYSDPHNKDEVSWALSKGASEERWKKVLKPKPMDVVVFSIYGFPAHCGVFIGDDRFVHSIKGSDSCVEKLSDLTWAKRVSGIYRWANN